MNRCTLCGGSLRSDGRCRDCGMDNTKNDRKYRLNIHNEHGAKLHQGDCEDNLNVNHSWLSADDKTAGRKNRTSTVRFETNDRKKKVSQTTTAKGSAKSTSKKQKERQSTGTIKKKGSCLSRLVKGLLIFYLLQAVASAILGYVNTPDFSGEWISDIVENLGDELTEDFSISTTRREPEVYEENIFPEEILPEEEFAEALIPEDIAVPRLDNHWDQSSPGYLEQELTTGIYTVGYDIPAGVYQITCDTGTAWLYWSADAEDYSHFECLYSEEEQKIYSDYSDGEACPYSAYSELMELKEGGVILVEDCLTDLCLRGISEEGASVQERDPQKDLGTAYLKDGMCAGDDFEPGVYDLILQDGSYGVSVMIYAPETEETHYIYLLEERNIFYRFPFSDGMEIEVETYGEECVIQLVPSY